MDREGLCDGDAARRRLEPNDTQPIAFDWLFRAELPAVTEDRTHLRAGYRTMAELVRYHQIGVAEGWIELDGERIEMADSEWVSTRDHSWGVRYDVGVPPVDVEGAGEPTIRAGVGFMMIWSPLLMERTDGSRYGLHMHFTRYSMPGFDQRAVVGSVEHPDGRCERIVEILPSLRFHSQPSPARRNARGRHRGRHRTTSRGRGPRRYGRRQHAADRGWAVARSRSPRRRLALMPHSPPSTPADRAYPWRSHVPIR